MPTNADAPRYLPVQIGEFSFAIPMAAVLAVHQLSGGGDLAALIAQSTQSGIHLIDTAALVDDPVHLTSAPYLLVLSAPQETWGLLVDSIRSSRAISSDQRQPLPPFLRRMGCPFSEVIRENDSLSLVIDIARLMEAESERRFSAEAIHAG